MNSSPDHLNQLIRASLDDWKRIRQHEADCGPEDWSDRASAMKTEQSIYAMHQQWGSNANQILLRIKEVAAAGEPIPSTTSLEDALGLTGARLKLTPEKAALEIERAANGAFIPAKELRDELHARLRA